jgi:hypothetical protein
MPDAHSNAVTVLSGAENCELENFDLVVQYRKASEDLTNLKLQKFHILFLLRKKIFAPL